MHVLILYASLEGQTEKIASYIAQEVQDKGYQVSLLSIDMLPADFSDANYHAVIIGGSIHMGNYPKPMKKLVKSHRDWLNKIPSALFTVCMGINSVEAKSVKEAREYGEHFIADTGWQPGLNETIAGAVKYTQYNFITRFIMKMISKREGGSTDTSRDHEYTSWKQVKQFAEKFVQLITKDT